VPDCLSTGIEWVVVGMLVTLFVEVAELEKFDGQRNEKATIKGHILKKIAEEIENE
jgi:hypothetical protein